MKIIFSGTLKKFKEAILGATWEYIKPHDNGKYNNIFTHVILMNLLFICLHLLLAILIIMPLLFMSICHDLHKSYYMIYFYLDKDNYNKMVKKTLNKYIETYTYGHTFKLYHPIDKFVHNPDMNIYDFISNFLFFYRNEYFTSRDNDLYYCGKYRRRSLTDIYGLCKYYYPNCTIDDVVIILIKLLGEKVIVGSYCLSTKLFVFHNDSLFYSINDDTEYGAGILWIDVVNAYKINKI